MHHGGKQREIWLLFYSGQGRGGAEPYSKNHIYHLHHDHSKSRGCSLQVDTNETQASPLPQQNIQGSWLQPAGLLESPFPTAPHRFEPRVSLKLHDLKEGLRRKKGRIRKHTLSPATAYPLYFFLSNTSLAQAKGRGVILILNEIDFF